MSISGIKKLPLKPTGYGTIEIGPSRLRVALDRNYHNDEVVKIPVIIKGFLTFPINAYDGVGQEYVIEVTEAKYR